VDGPIGREDGEFDDTSIGFGVSIPANLSDANALEFDERASAIVKRTSALLDLGGIGKGWAADRAAFLMRRTFSISAGMIDAGGDIRVWSDGDPWCIGVQNPFDEEEEIVHLWVQDAAVATSNVLHRRWSNGGRLRHHILDGRTGLPTETDIVQATVLGTATSEAEVAAKAICMLGSEQAAVWMADRFPRLGFLFVNHSGELFMNAKLQDYTVRIKAV
jgi:thiamine biosynthesis lipoprotein